MAQAFKSVAVSAARAAEDKKGEAIALYHPGAASPIADFILLATANSGPHLETLEKMVTDAVRLFNLRCLRRAGSDQWRVLDFGGLLVHLMTEQTRAFYALDKLYIGAPRVRWQAPRRAATASTRA